MIGVLCRNWFTLCSIRVLAILSVGNLKAQMPARTVLPFQLEEQIPVPGVAGRLDHFTADAKRKRLFVSADAVSRCWDLSLHSFPK